MFFLFTTSKIVVVFTMNDLRRILQEVEKTCDDYDFIISIHGDKLIFWYKTKFLSRVISIVLKDITVITFKRNTKGNILSGVYGQGEQYVGFCYSKRK